MNRVAIRKDFDHTETDRRLDTVSWWSVADYAKSKTCHQRQNSGQCSCQRKRPPHLNPCDYAEEVASACEFRARGGLDTHLTIVAIRDWISKHSCHAAQAGQMCGHRACDRVTVLLAWLDQQLRLAA